MQPAPVGLDAQEAAVRRDGLEWRCGVRFAVMRSGLWAGSCQDLLFSAVIRRGRFNARSARPVRQDWLLYGGALANPNPRCGSRSRL